MSVESIARLIGRPELLRLGAVPAAADEPERLIPDVTRLSATGFTPKHTLDEGLALTIESWRQRLIFHTRSAQQTLPSRRYFDAFSGICARPVHVRQLR